ncbi:hypothetical protein [Peptoniphilus asaccharolyticus]
MIIFQQDQNYIKEHANYETGVCYEFQFNFYIWSDNKVTKDSFANYIKSGLRRDCPVAYLQYWNSNQSDYDWHWMTITKYFRNTTNGDRYIAVSTWGERHSLNFNALWDGNLACGVLYFK